MTPLKENEVKSYKWVSLQPNPPKNAVLYVLDPLTKEVELFVTDRNGVPKPVKSAVDINIAEYVKLGSDNAIIVNNNQLFVKKYVSGDDYIEITETSNNYEIKLVDDKLELVDNKQNSLDPDGTGTKYPTVDAVNEALANATGDKNFVYEQTTPALIWEIQHPLQKNVSVTVTDSAGTVIAGQVTINNGNLVTIEFNIPFWGYAYLN